MRLKGTSQKCSYQTLVDGLSFQTSNDDSRLMPLTLGRHVIGHRVVSWSRWGFLISVYFFFIFCIMQQIVQCGRLPSRNNHNHSNNNNHVGMRLGKVGRL